MRKRNRKEYNARKEVKHRIDRLDRETQNDSIEKSRSFISMNIAENKLHLRLKSISERKEILDKDESEALEQIEIIKNKRKELGYEHEIVITEHAMLRYCERYLGIDMNEVYHNILKLPKKDITKFGNTIVTVYPVKNEKVTLDDLDILIDASDVDDKPRPQPNCTISGHNHEYRYCPDK